MKKHIENTLKLINELLDSQLFKISLILFSVFTIIGMNFFLMYKIFYH
jgi:hypothetical protein